MKKITILVCLFSLLAASNIYSQNLYYESRKIADFIDKQFEKEYALDSVLKKIEENNSSSIIDSINQILNKKKEGLIYKIKELKDSINYFIKSEVFAKKNELYKLFNSNGQFQMNSNNFDDFFNIKISNISKLNQEEKAQLNYISNLKNEISVYEKAISDIDQISTSENQTKSLSSNLLSSFSTPTALIDGVSQFLVERTREELNIAFVDKLREVFKRNEEFIKLFPSVSNIVLYNDPLNFSTWGQQLQIAAKSDIAELPLTFTNFIRNQAVYNNLPEKKKELLETSFIIMQSLIYQKNGFGPVDMLNILNSNFGYDKDSRILPINKTITLLEAITESFYIEDSNSFVSNDLILKLIKDDTHRKIFLTLFAYKYKYILDDISFNNTNLFKSILKTNKSIEKELLGYSAQLSVAYNKVQPLIKKLAVETITDTLKAKLIKELNYYFLDLYDIGFKLNYIGMSATYLSDSGWYFKYRPVVKNIIELNNYILDKNYTAAMLSFNNMMIPVLNDIIKTSTDTMSDFILNNKRTIENLVYWGGFLTEFTSLKNESGDFKALLKKYAEPVGSYRIKRNSRVSFTLNAYPGFFIGTESNYPLYNLYRYKKNYSFTTSITAPIGFSLNWGFAKKANRCDFDIIRCGNLKKLRGSVWGFFIPIVDIGAPFAYRWSNDSIKGFPDEIKWSQIFSPGLYATYGLKN